MFEIRISPLAASAAGELGAAGGGIFVIEDSPFGLAGAEEGGDSLVPPHAISIATESRSDDIRVTMRIMSWLSSWVSQRD
jgi:beta-phosphoglucomutase-like phosphatase (HAD superfamily)